jgi:hypothetical protein
MDLAIQWTFSQEGLGSVEPVVLRSNGAQWVLLPARDGAAMIGLDAATGAIGPVWSADGQTAIPGCGGGVGAAADPAVVWLVWRSGYSGVPSENTGTTWLQRFAVDEVPDQRLSDPLEITPNWSCSIVDLGADGTFEAASPVGAWSIADLEPVAVFEPPIPFPDGTWRRLEGDHARPGDILGDCNPLRPQEDGLLDLMNAEVVATWDLRGGGSLRSLSGAFVRVDGVLVMWGVEALDGGGSIDDPPQRVLMWRTDGSLVWQDELLGAGTPAIADADGDGEPEMCVPGFGGELRMYEGDGSLAWSLPGRGDSAVPERFAAAEFSNPHCVMADHDADSAHEVVYFDQRGLRILDGRTGATLSEATDYVLPGGRDWISPSVADLDGDGSAEIVLGGYSSASTEWEPPTVVVAYTAASGDFARTRPFWNDYAYDASSIDEDGRMISWPTPSWDAYNTYRAQPSFDGDHPDLVPVVVDLCGTEGACDGTAAGDILVSVQVENRGSRDQPAGAMLRVFTEPLSGCFEEVASAPLPAIDAGWSSDAVVLTVPALSWASRRVLEVAYDVPIHHDDRDCDIVNNRLVISEDACP